MHSGQWWRWLCQNVICSTLKSLRYCEKWSEGMLSVMCYCDCSVAEVPEVGGLGGSGIWKHYMFDVFPPMWFQDIWSFLPLHLTHWWRWDCGQPSVHWEHQSFDSACLVLHCKERTVVHIECVHCHGPTTQCTWMLLSRQRLVWFTIAV